MGRKTEPEHSTAVAERVEMCGQCQMDVKETAILCDVEEAAISDGALTKCYIKGKLEAELAVRRSLLQKAQDGDGNAQKEFLKMAESIRFEA